MDPLVAEVLGAQREHFGPRPPAKRGQGARSKLLAYFKEHVGEVLYGEELSVISGIGEWARRVRELRVQDGYPITELGNSSYRLERLEPDEGKARDWQELNALRRRGGSARSRLEALFEARVGEVVSREQIDYVAGSVKEGTRRVRELRDEAGWPINSHIDEPDLGPGEYRLLSTDPADRREASQRLYPENLRQKVFERDNYTCQACGKDREKALSAGETRFYLEVHHKVAMADELATLPVHERHDISNLVTLCHTDHLAETAKLQKQRRAQRRS